MFGAPPCIQITDRALFEATQAVLPMPFLVFRARSAHSFPRHDPALQLSALAKMCPVLAREAQYRHLAFFFLRAWRALELSVCSKPRACATDDFTKCTGAWFEAPPNLTNATGTCFEAYRTCFF